MKKAGQWKSRMVLALELPPLRKYKFEDIEIRQDLAGLDRVVLGRKKLQEDKYV